MATYVGADASGFSDYFEARGVTIPGTWSEDDINAALLVASEWIDRTYGASFIGEKATGFLQDREWPRINAIVHSYDSYVFPVDTIPQQVLHSVYEAAYRQLASPGSLLVDYTPGKYKRVSIDGALSVEYAQFSSAYDMQKTFPIIDQILASLFDDDGFAGSYSSRTSRV